MGANRFALLLIAALLIGQGSAELIRRNYTLHGLSLAFVGGSALWILMVKSDD